VADLHRLLQGYQVTQAVHVAAVLGIADLLKEGPRSSDALAKATQTHPPTLYRLLRALASAGVLDEREDRTFALAPLGEQLRTDHPESLHGWAAFLGRPAEWSAWAHLEESVRTGENAFRLTHGTDVWSYRAERPVDSAIFDAAMQSLTAAANRALVAAYDFGRFETIVDVGGGNGTFVAAILSAHPRLHGVLYDQPHVVARAREVIEAVSDRCRVESGSFFDSVPSGGDAYLLKAIIHDWEDAQCGEILAAIRRVVRSDAAVLVIERVVGPPNEDPATKFSDLNMLVAPGGRERTLDEFADLFAAAGFRLVSETRTAAGLSVLEATPGQ
jgi:hypothetical protein